MSPLPIAAVHSLEALEDVLATEESFGFTTVALWATGRADMPNMAAFRLAPGPDRRPDTPAIALERVGDPSQLGALIAKRAAKGYRLSFYTTATIAGEAVAVAGFHRPRG
jgi:hypothetical protein